MICTDVSKLSYQDIYEKLYYDIFLDKENYNHVIPITLLSLEFLVNNIDFTWSHLLITILLNILYIVFQYFYCVKTHKVIYQGIDWNEDAKGSAIKCFAACMITIPFFFMVKFGNHVKFY